MPNNAYPRTVNPETGSVEDEFRGTVRDILDLDWSKRDYQIFAELRRLKQLEQRVVNLEVNLVVDGKEVAKAIVDTAKDRNIFDVFYSNADC